MDELEGLEYDELTLDNNVHKLVDSVTKQQGEETAKVEIDKGSCWLAVSLGQINDNAPEKELAEAIQDIIIIDKKILIEFIKQKKNG